MARDDSILYTGMTSPQSQKIREDRQKSKKEKEQKKAPLLPFAVLIMQDLRKERDELKVETLNAVQMDMDEQTLKAVKLAYQMSEDRLISATNRIKNTLRLHEEKK